MKRVYVVTYGEYSDYEIEKIFYVRVKAHMYSLLNPDRRVEEYCMDDVELKINKRYLLVSYDYRYNHAHEFTLRSTPLKPRISKEWGRHFEFTIPLSDERIYKNICRYGKNSKVVLKIAQDKFAEYCYEHNTTKEKLIQKHEEEYRKNSAGYYSLASTSSSFDNSAYRQRLVVNERVATALKKMIFDGKPLQQIEELQTIYDVTASEVKKDHGETEQQ